MSKIKVLLITAFSCFFAFLCVGYASLTGNLSITGYLGVMAQDGVFLYQATKTNDTAGTEHSLLSAILILEFDNTGTVSYELDFRNRDQEYDYYYLDTIVPEGVSVEFEKVNNIPTLKQYDLIPMDTSPGNTGTPYNVKCKITTSVVGKQVIKFHFVKKNTVVIESFPWVGNTITSRNITFSMPDNMGGTNNMPYGSKTYTATQCVLNPNYSATIAKVNYVEVISTTEVVQVTPNGSNYDIKWGDNEHLNCEAPWGPVVHEDNNVAIYVYENTLYITGGDPAGNIFVDNLDYAFANLTNLDTSATTSAFRNLHKLNTFHCTSMIGTFMNCSMGNINLEGWSGVNVTSMESMFDGCTNLQKVDFSTFDTYSVSDFRFMFNQCESLMTTYDSVNGDHGYVNLTAFDLSNAEYMTGMFNKCKSLTGVDMYNPNGIKMEEFAPNGKNPTMYYCHDMQDAAFMFFDCWNLKQVDLRGFKSTGVPMTGFFANSSWHPYQIKMCISFGGHNSTNIFKSQIYRPGLELGWYMSKHSYETSFVNTLPVTNRQGLLPSCMFSGRAQKLYDDAYEGGSPCYIEYGTTADRFLTWPA